MIIKKIYSTVYIPVRRGFGRVLHENLNEHAVRRLAEIEEIMPCGCEITC
jgi:hypothetical protein